MSLRTLLLALLTLLSLSVLHVLHAQTICGTTGTIKGSDFVRQGHNSGHIQLVTIRSEVLRWEISTDKGRHWQDIGHAGETHLDYRNLIEETWYRAIVEANCPFGAQSPTAKICLLESDRFNTEYSRAYDENGREVAASASYTDAFGRLVQQQTRNQSEKQVLAVQQVFDRRGEAALTTLPAPLHRNSFGYREHFITNDRGDRYGAGDFDAPGTGEGSRDRPRPVGSTGPGSLGHYYSSANTLEPLTPHSTYPYSRTWTEPGPDALHSKAAGPGEALRMGAGHEASGERQQWYAAELEHYQRIANTYFPQAIAPLFQGYKYFQTDPNGRQTIAYRDAEGRSIVTARRRGASEGSAEGIPYTDYSYTYYNQVGEVLARIAPKGVEALRTARLPDHYPAREDLPYTELYEYFTNGLLKAVTEPDAGRTEYLYRKDGAIRFSQNAEQRREGTFSYTDYDPLGRPIEAGVYRPQRTDLQFGSPGLRSHLEDRGYTSVFLPARKEDWIRSHYSDPDPDYHRKTGLGERYPQKEVRNTVSHTENEHIETWYSYDIEGQLRYFVQKPKALDRVFVSEYDYNFLGDITRTGFLAYDTEGQLRESFYHHYSYDADRRLHQVHTGTDGQREGAIEQARYSYYLHGPLKRVTLAENLQGIDFTYTIEGWLRAINHPDPGKDPGGDGHNGVREDAFGILLQYYDSEIQGLYRTGSIRGIDVRQRHGLDPTPKVAPELAAAFAPLRPVIGLSGPEKGLPSEPGHLARTWQRTPATAAPDGPALAALDWKAQGLQGEGFAEVLRAYAERRRAAAYDRVPDAIELAALRDLFEATNGTAWKKNTHWPEPGHWPATATAEEMAQWFGLREENGDISAIYLAKNGLQGTLPESIGDLKGLKILWAYGNQLSGALPTSITALSELEQLKLEFNALRGSIPENIGQYRHLQILDLTNNRLEGSIPESIGDLSALRRLGLGGNLLSGTLPTSLNALKGLKHLSLGPNRLEGSVALDFSEWSDLDYLSLKRNGFSGPLPSGLGQLRNLKQLLLGNNAFSGSIPDLSALGQLEILELNHNQLTGPVPSGIIGLPQLHTVMLHYNRLTGGIPAALGSAVQLRRLYLSGNELGGRIPMELGHLSRLRVLYLDRCGLEGELPPGLAAMSELRYLNLERNALSGPLPDMARWGELVMLYLNHNSFTGPLPESVAALRKLQLFQAQSNGLSGRIPEGFLTLPLLARLQLSYNAFEALPDFTAYPRRDRLSLFVDRNRIALGDIARHLQDATGKHGFRAFTYSHQQGSLEEREVAYLSGALRLSTEDLHAENSYRWQYWHDGGWQDLDHARESFLYVYPDVLREGRRYRAVVSNAWLGATRTDEVLVLRRGVAPPAGDHRATSLYNGTITAMSWRTEAIGSSATGATRGMYLLDYDERYQLKDAVWAEAQGPTGFTLQGNRNRVTGLRYDAHGNILSLQRFDAAAEKTDDFSYDYLPHTNRLGAIAGHAAYSYNDLGQLTGMYDRPEGAPDRFFTYDVTGKVRQVHADAEKSDLRISYDYDDRGFRLRRTDHATGAETWYIRDASGNVLSIYERRPGEGPVWKEVPIYAADRIAGYAPAEGEYSYELKDHLGNVRALLHKGRSTYTATMELATSTGEEALFDGLDTRFRAPFAGIDHTTGRAEGQVALLNGAPGRRVGPNRSLAVEAGDVVHMETYVKYLRAGSPTPTGAADMFAAVVSAFGGANGGTALEQSVHDLFQGNFAGALPLIGTGEEEGTVPRAYLNYLFFDEDFRFRYAGYATMTEAAKVTLDARGHPVTTAPHEKLSLDFRAETKGFVYIYVANESIGGGDVYFDDLRLEYVQGHVRESTDYYPFGGVLRRSRQEGHVPYRYGYQGDYAEQDPGTGWNSFELREYDSRIGRFTTVDPYGQFWSPYMAMGNDPVNNVDPDGGFADPIFQGVLPEIVIRATGGFTVSSILATVGHVALSSAASTAPLIDIEYQEHAFGGTFEQYVTKYPEFSGLSHADAHRLWESKYANDFYDRWTAEAQREKDLRNIGKMARFVEGFTEAGSFGMGAFGSVALPTLKAFSGTSRGMGSVVRGANTVYRGIDAAGKVRYVGITSRNPALRFAEHLGSGTNKALLRYRPVPGASNLSRTGARVWEQRLINQYGLGKNGGSLFNRINSISPSKWHLHGIR